MTEAEIFHFDGPPDGLFGDYELPSGWESMGMEALLAEIMLRNPGCDRTTAIAVWNAAGDDGVEVDGFDLPPHRDPASIQLTADEYAVLCQLERANANDPAEKRWRDVLDQLGQRDLVARLPGPPAFWQITPEGIRRLREFEAPPPGAAISRPDDAGIPSSSERQGIRYADANDPALFEKRRIRAELERARAGAQPASED
jgi:hypothetical protein